MPHPYLGVMPAAVADQFSTVFGNSRGARRTEQEEAELLQSLRGEVGLPVFPFAENDEVAQRRLRLVRWLESHDRSLQSVARITLKSRIYGGELLLKRVFLIDWAARREREAICDILRPLKRGGFPTYGLAVRRLAAGDIPAAWFSFRRPQTS